MALTLLSCNRCCDGEQRVYSHQSATLRCEMKFGVFVPPCMLGGEDKTPCPVFYYLSGLTSNHEKFIFQSGMQQFAAKEGLLVVNPDTSPRNVIASEDDTYDFGSGASFYVNATVEPWSRHYQMFTYITEELVQLINSNFPVNPNKKGICGHSMGGHGALICALRMPGYYQSVSAIAPVCNAVKSSLGRKAFKGYLGEDEKAWDEWDATKLAEAYDGPPLEFLIDQGTTDEFLVHHHLLPENLLSACKSNDNLQMIYKLLEGYDHSYFHVSTVIGEHIAYHAKLLKAS